MEKERAVSILLDNQCDKCLARALVMKLEGDVWSASCWCCGIKQYGSTMQEAAQLWRDSRDMKKMNELRKEYELAYIS